MVMVKGPKIQITAAISAISVRDFTDLFFIEVSPFSDVLIMIFAFVILLER